MSNGSFYIEVFAHFTGAFGEQCIPAWLPPAWQKNPRKRKLSRQQCNSRNFSDKLLHQLIDCFDMFLLHSDRQASTFNGLQTTMLSCAGKCS